MYSIYSLSLSDLSPTTLGFSFALCSIIMYTAITKMLGLGSKNEFEVDDRVRLVNRLSTANLLTTFLPTDGCYHWRF